MKKLQENTILTTNINNNEINNNKKSDFSFEDKELNQTLQQNKKNINDIDDINVKKKYLTPLRLRDENIKVNDQEKKKKEENNDSNSKKRNDNIFGNIFFVSKTNN